MPKSDLDAGKTRNLGSGLFVAAGKLKEIKRSGWQKKAGITKDCESVADHSFRLAVLGMFYGIELGLDAAKVIRMCLIHDLAESELGDLTPEEKISFDSHREDEDIVMRKVLSRLPAKSKAQLVSDWSELLRTESEEAKLVWVLDKLEMNLQSRDYERMGYEKKTLREFQEKFLEKTFPNLHPLTN